MNLRSELDDSALPAVAILLGSEAGELLGSSLGEQGGRVASHTISQVRYVPRRSITVQYRVDAIWGDGRSTKEVVVATSGIKVPPHVALFGAEGTEIALWQFPNDPFLPGLKTASDVSGVGGLLRQLDAPTDGIQLRTRAYRAGRRSVIEVTAPDTRVFIKVVRPDRAERLQRIHSELSAQVPVPRSLGWSQEDGIVALQALEGRTLRNALESRSQLPHPASILGLLDQFSAPLSDASRVSGPRERVRGYGQLLSVVVPSLKGRIDEISGRLHAEGNTGSEPVHGDFHSSQILTSGSDLVGIVDVDTAGVGDRVDDLASLLGQLATLSLGSPAGRDIDTYGAALIAEFDPLVDPVELRLRTAAAVLGLATGPFRVQLRGWEGETEKRLALAERWVRSADEVGKSD